MQPVSFSGRKLAQMMEERSYNDAELARLLTLIVPTDYKKPSRQHVHSWRTGQTRPDTAYLYYIAQVFGKSMDDFMEVREAS